MTGSRLFLASVTAAGLVFAIAPARSPIPAKTPFEELSMILEVNATDGDAEIVTNTKAPAGLRELLIYFPKVRKPVMTFTTKDPIGQTHVRLESGEPNIDDVLAAFPEGNYEFNGTTVAGEKVSGFATLSHHVLEAPTLVAPCDGCTVPPKGVVIEWLPVFGASHFIVEIENDDLAFNVTAKIDGAQTSFAIPDGLLQVDTEYEFGVASVSAEGNVVFTESSFVTSH